MRHRGKHSAPTMTRINFHLEGRYRNSTKQPGSCFSHAQRHFIPLFLFLKWTIEEPIWVLNWDPVEDGEDRGRPGQRPSAKTREDWDWRGRIISTRRIGMDEGNALPNVQFCTGRFLFLNSATLNATYKNYPSVCWWHSIIRWIISVALKLKFASLVVNFFPHHCRTLCTKVNTSLSICFC